MSLIDQVRTACQDAFYVAFPQLVALQSPILVTKSTKAAFGDYQCNSAMALAKPLAQSPRDIAQQVCKALTANASDLFQRVEVAGPGFINLTLSVRFLGQLVDKMAASPHLGILAPAQPQRIVIDFSSPNIAKEMHVGHLRSTIIGDALANVLRYLGHDVLRLNHVGDWGTSFGMLIAYLKTHQAQVYEGKETASLTDLVTWYKAAKVCFDSDSAFKTQAQQAVVALQGGDESVRRVWQMICAISRQAYQIIYDRLAIDIQERGESFYNPRLAPMVAQLEATGMITHSDGAKCIFLPGFTNRDGQPLPFMVQKSDGGFNYATTDLAALQQRVEEEHAERIIYVTDSGQSEHFRMLFAAAAKAGFVTSDNVLLEHVPFGVVLNQDGKKFKTRSGETEKLIDLLDEAVTKAKTILVERNLELSDEALAHAANVLGIGAVKYADLSTDRINDYMFSYEKMLRFEGNTAVFILYAYVRTSSILRRAGDEQASLSPIPVSLEHPSEVALAVKLAQWHDALNSVAAELLPHRLTDYLYTLATTFNGFFRDCPVIGADTEASRLTLCTVTRQVLHAGLSLLGIGVLEKM